MAEFEAQILQLDRQFLEEAKRFLVALENHSDVEELVKIREKVKELIGTIHKIHSLEN